MALLAQRLQCRPFRERAGHGAVLHPLGRDIILSEHLAVHRVLSRQVVEPVHAAAAVDDLREVPGFRTALDRLGQKPEYLPLRFCLAGRLNRTVGEDEVHRVRGWHLEGDLLVVAGGREHVVREHARR